MNRVHEQCPKIDSGTVLSQTRSKQVECTECTACWPSSTPGRAPSAHAAGALRASAACPARRCRLHRAPRAPLTLPRAPCAPAPRLRAQRPPAPACPPRTSLAHPAASLLRTPAPTCAPRASSALPNAVSWPSDCIAIQTMPCLSHNTIHCISIESSLQPAFLPQYTRLYCDTNCPQPSLLQYNPAIQLSLFSAIQTSVLQYTSSPS